MPTGQRMPPNSRGPHGGVFLADDDKDDGFGSGGGERNGTVRHNSSSNDQSKRTQSGPSWYRSHAKPTELSFQSGGDSK